MENDRKEINDKYDRFSIDFIINMQCEKLVYIKKENEMVLSFSRESAIKLVKILVIEMNISLKDIIDI